LYFFGLDYPGFAGILDIDSGEEIIFADDIDIEDIIWMGVQPSVKDLSAKVGVDKTQPFNKLSEVLAKAKSQNRKIHFLPPYRAENKILLESLIRNSSIKTKSRSIN
jgi:Xaa-Pro aminopeptidase